MGILKRAKKSLSSSYEDRRRENCLKLARDIRKDVSNMATQFMAAQHTLRSYEQYHAHEDEDDATKLYIRQFNADVAFTELEKARAHYYEAIYKLGELLCELE